MGIHWAHVSLQLACCLHTSCLGRGHMLDFAGVFQHYEVRQLQNTAHSGVTEVGGDLDPTGWAGKQGEVVKP